MNVLSVLNINSEKIKLFIATGLQGFYRILILLVVEIKYGLSKVGELGIQFSVSQIICTLTVVGFCTLILSRISSEKIQKKKYELFYELVSSILAILIISLIFINLFNNFFKFRFVLEICFWLFSWTIYITSRHFFLAERKYSAIIIADFWLIILSILVIMADYFSNISIALSIIMILISCVNFINIGNFGCIKLNKFKIDLKGFLFGGAQFLSSTLFLILIPISVYFLSSDEVGIVSLYVNLTTSTLILSRTISLYLITELSKIKSNKTVLINRIKIIQHKLIFFSIILFLVNLIILKFLIEIYKINNFQLIISFLLISVYCLINNFTILYSSLIIINEHAKENFLIHIKLFLIFIICIYFSYFHINNYNYPIICFGLSFIGLLRFYRYKKIYNKNIVNKS